MDIFVDTSAFYALMDADDQNHERARAAWSEWLDQPTSFFCSNYVLLESTTLIQRRLGMLAVRRFEGDIVPLCQVHWVSPDLYAAALDALLVAGQHNLSLIDCTSFGIMRHLGLRIVFAFDRHFIEQGFACRP